LAQAIYAQSWLASHLAVFGFSCLLHSSMRFCRHLLLLVHFGLSGAAYPHQGQLLRSQSLAVSSSAALVAESGNADVKSDASIDFKSNASNDVKSTVSKDTKSNGSTDVNLNHSAGANQSKPESKPFSLNKSNAEASVVDSVPDPDHMEEPPEGSYALEAIGLEEKHEEHVETPLSKGDPIAPADGVAKQHPHDEPPKHQEDSSLDFSVNETYDAEMFKAMDSEADPPVEAKSSLIAQESEHGTEDEPSKHQEDSSLDFSVNETYDAEMTKAMESEADPPDKTTVEAKPSLIAQESEHGTEDEGKMTDDMSAQDLEDVPQDGPNDLSEIKPPQDAALQQDDHDDPIKLAEEVAKQYPNDQLPPDAELEDLEDH